MISVIGEWPQVASVDFGGTSAGASGISVWFGVFMGVWSLAFLPCVGLETTRRRKEKKKKQ